ncbi:hypothetical protein FDECE_8478 [Fusarium decemcellulare]|nr:hypothetical protein FDECE_8478 [Fusarium decemcellulare]
MEPDSVFPLVAATRASLYAFNVLVSSLGATTNDNHRKLMPLVALQNQRDRLKIWAGNLGALQHGSASLDTRLRESSVMRTTILKHINQLQEAIKRSTEVVQGFRPSLEETFESDELIWDSSTDSSSSEEGEHTSLRTELGQSMAEITAILSDLFKLSLRIRNPTTRLTPQPVRKALLYREMVQTDDGDELDILECYSNFDRAHVKDVFRQFRGMDDLEGPDDYLLERWTKSITNRRRIFAYWRKHAKKLAKETGQEQAAVKGPEPFLNLPERTHPKPGERPVLSIADPQTRLSVTERTGLSGTEATEYNLKLDEEIDSESTISYATTAYGLDGSTAELPQAPLVQPGQSEFTCPYCWITCPARHAKGKYWRAHILQDLQPYMCTYPDCSNAEAMYGTRNAWLHHEEQAHRKVWRCFEHGDFFKSKETLKHHLVSQHRDLGQAQVQSMVDLAHAALKDTRTTCPFCLLEGPFSRGFENHVAYHQERLARFALPRGAEMEVDHSVNDKSSRGANRTRSMDSLRSISLSFVSAQLSEHSNLAVSLVATETEQDEAMSFYNRIQRDIHLNKDGKKFLPADTIDKLVCREIIETELGGEVSDWELASLIEFILHEPAKKVFLTLALCGDINSMIDLWKSSLCDEHLPVVEVALPGMEGGYFKNEADALEKIRGFESPHLVTPIASFRYHGEENGCFLLPWAEGGDLTNFWADETSSLEDARMMTWVLDQLRGLCHALSLLHGKGIYHGFVMPQTILHFKEGDYKGILRLTNVGASKDDESTRYAAPEFAHGKRMSPTDDVWALGCIFLEFVMWMVYGDKKLNEFLEAVDSGFWWNSGSEVAIIPEVQFWLGRIPRRLPSTESAISDLFDLIVSHMFVKNPDKRSTSVQVHEHLVRICNRASRDPNYLMVGKGPT